MLAGSVVSSPLVALAAEAAFEASAGASQGKFAAKIAITFFIFGYLIFLYLPPSIEYVDIIESDTPLSKDDIDEKIQELIENKKI